MDWAFIESGWKQLKVRAHTKWANSAQGQFIDVPLTKRLPPTGKIHDLSDLDHHGPKWRFDAFAQSVHEAVVSRSRRNLRY